MILFLYLTFSVCDKLRKFFDMFNKNKKDERKQSYGGGSVFGPSSVRDV